MDTFLELKRSLRHLPYLDALLLNCQELDRVRQVDLRQLRVLVTVCDHVADLSCGCVIHWVRHCCWIRCVLQDTDTKTGLLQIQVIVADKTNRLSPIEIPD